MDQETDRSRPCYKCAHSANLHLAVFPTGVNSPAHCPELPAWAAAGNAVPLMKSEYEEGSLVLRGR